MGLIGGALKKGISEIEPGLGFFSLLFVFWKIVYPETETAVIPIITKKDMMTLLTLLKN